MRFILNILTLVASLFAIILAAGFIYGLLTDAFSDGRGMAIVIIQLWGVIAGGLALALGLLGVFIGRGAPGARTPARIAKFGIFAGVLSIATLALLLAF